MNLDQEQLRARMRTAAGWVDAYGPLVIALYFIVTARWGAFVVPGPPYIGDLALGLLIAERGIRVVRTGSFDPGLRRPAVALIAVTLAYATVVLATGEISTDAVRDAAPYLYMVLALLAARSHRVPAPRVANLLYWALAAHVVTVVFARLFDVENSVALDASRDAYLLLERPDIGGAITGIAAAVALGRIARGHQVPLNLALAATAWAVVMTNESRAAFLASCAVIVLVGAREIRFGLIAKTRVRTLRPALGLVAASVLVLVPAVQLAVGTNPLPVDRAVGAVQGTIEVGGFAQRPGEGAPSGSGPESSQYEGYGTARARINAWKRLVEWLHEDGAERTITGVGFGPHYWQISGADHHFEGTDPTESNRAAHNFVLNTWARLGLIGVLLVSALALFVLWIALRELLGRSDATEATLIAALLAISILIVSSLGVVFEAPFGALPLFWAVGYLLARPDLIERDRTPEAASPPATPA